MPAWLVKSDPEDYSAADLQRDRATDWTGVASPAAQKNMRAMTPGDRVLVYHTGGEKAIVATASVASAPQPDPADKSGKRVFIRLTFGKWLQTPVPLSAIKADPAFKTFDLVRISRLSVMPVTAAHESRLLKLAGGESGRRP